MRLKRVAAPAVAMLLLSAIALLAVGARSSAPAANDRDRRFRGHTIPYLYEAHVRIPLAVRAPWRKDMRGRIAQPVSTLDVAPTILDLFDIPAPPSMTGVSLGRPRPAGRVVVSEAAPHGAIALLEGNHKVIVRPGFRARHWETDDWLDRLPAQECFDLGRDPAERNGTACTEPWARKLLGEAARYVASSFPGDFVIRAEPRGGPCRLDMGSATDYPPELTARLRSLGYVSADRVVPASTRPAGPAAEGALPPAGRIRITIAL